MFIQLCDKTIMLFYFFSPYCAVAQRQQQDTQKYRKKN